MTKLVVIVQILVAERNAEHALPDERGDGVLDEPRVSRVTKTSRNPANQAQTLVGGAQQQAAGVGRERAAVERGHNRPPFDLFASGHSSEPAQVVITKQLLPDSAARCATQFEKLRLGPLNADRSPRWPPVTRGMAGASPSSPIIF